MTSPQWRWIPNALTFLRLALVFPFAWLLWREDYCRALAVFVVAALSDGLDGFLARRFSWHSDTGALVDPLADKALLVTSFLMLTLTSVLPLWLFLVVLFRDLLIVSGALIYRCRAGRFEMQPSIPGKLNTLIQILVVVVAIAIQAGAPALPWVLQAGVMLVALSAVFSGAHYTLVWGRKLWRAGGQ